MFVWLLSFLSNPLVLQAGASLITAFFKGKELTEQEVRTLNDLSIVLQKRGVQMNLTLLEEDKRQKEEITELWKKIKAERESNVD